MKSKCIKCGYNGIVKNGFIQGKQRYKCKKCGHQFTTDKPRGLPEQKKRTAIMLYAAGFKMRSIAEIINTSVQTVSRWIKLYGATKNYEIPKMSHFEKTTYRDSLRLLQQFPDEELDKEYYAISTELVSGYKIRIMIHKNYD